MSKGTDVFFSQIGSALKILRHARGLMARELAERSGLGKGQLSKYETRIELPYIPSLARLLDVLAVDPLWFFSLVDFLAEHPEVQVHLGEDAPGRSRCPSEGHRSAEFFFSALGTALMVHRERKGLGAAALARTCKLGKSQYSAYENGRRLPKFATLAKILDALEVEPLRFFSTVHHMSEAGDWKSLLTCQLLLSPTPYGILNAREAAGYRGLLEVLLRFFRHRVESELGIDLQNS